MKKKYSRPYSSYMDYACHSLLIGCSFFSFIHFADATEHLSLDTLPSPSFFVKSDEDKKQKSKYLRNQQMYQLFSLSSTPSFSSLEWNRKIKAFDAQNKRISNVDDGVENYDAVNLRQLSKLQEDIAQLKESIQTVIDNSGDNKISYLASENAERPERWRNIADGVNNTDAVNVRQYRALENKLSGQISRLERKMSDVESDAHGAGAIAMALSGLTFDNRPGKFSFSVGIGHWRSQTSIAAGGHYATNNGRVRFKTNLAIPMSFDSLGLAGGFGYTVN